jgi:hypothetical protein
MEVFQWCKWINRTESLSDVTVTNKSSDEKLFYYVSPVRKEPESISIVGDPTEKV